MAATILSDERTDVRRVEHTFLIKDDFEKFVREEGNRIFRTVYCMLGGDHHESEDVTQEVFLRAFKALAEFRGDSSLSTWVHGIACNAVREYIRKKSRRRQRVKIVNEDNIEETSFSDAMAEDVVYGCMEANIDSDEIRKALQNLNESHRSVVVLRDIEGLSYKEIADALGISIGTVESRLFRAREILKKQLSSYMTSNG